jgi:ABC-type multidrug transport system fused ATPase/permease subunit
MTWRSSYLLERVKAPSSPSSEVLDVSKPKKLTNIRRLMNLIWLEWPALCAGVLGLSLSSFTNLLFPKVLGTALDVACGRPAPRNLSNRAFLLSIASIFISGAITSFVRVYCLGSVAQSTAKRLRDHVFAAILNQEFLYVSQFERTDLIHRLDEQCNVAAESAVTIIAEVYRSLNSVVGASIMLYRLSPMLTLVSLSTLPCIGVSAMSFHLFMSRLHKAYEAQLAILRASSDEKLSAFATVKMCTQEAFEHARFAAMTTLVATTGRRYKAAEGLFMGGLSLCINASLASVLWVGGSIVARGDLTSGGLTSFMLYSGFMCLGFSQLSTLAAKIRKTNDASMAIFCLLDDNDDNMNRQSVPTTSVLPPTRQERILVQSRIHGHLKLAHVGFRYPSRPDSVILADLSWDVPAGSMVALVGASGAGKSTLAAILAQLLPPEPGSQLLLDGIDMAQLDRRWLRQQIGLVQQVHDIF